MTESVSATGTDTVPSTTPRADARTATRVPTTASRQARVRGLTETALGRPPNAGARVVLWLVIVGSGRGRDGLGRRDRGVRMDGPRQQREAQEQPRPGAGHGRVVDRPDVAVLDGRDRRPAGALGNVLRLD